MEYPPPHLAFLLVWSSPISLLNNVLDESTTRAVYDILNNKNTSAELQSVVSVQQRAGLPVWS